MIFETLAAMADRSNDGADNFNSTPAEAKAVIEALKGTGDRSLIDFATKGGDSQIQEETLTVAGRTITNDKVQEYKHYLVGMQLKQPQSVVQINIDTPDPIVVPSVPWNPTYMTLQQWLDAQDAATITATGALVDQLGDKSGNDRNGIGSGGLRPSTGVQTINGYNSIFFNAAHELNLGVPTWLNGQEYFIIAVCQNINYEGTNGFMGIKGSDVAKGAAWGSGQADQAFSVEHVSGGSGIAQFASGSTTFTPYLYECKYNSPGAEIWRDGTSLGVDLAAPDIDLAVTAEPLTLGNVEPVAYPWEGYFGELIIVTGTISLSDRFKLEGYLAHKWGMTGVLPVSHLYKSAIPMT